MAQFNNRTLVKLKQPGFVRTNSWSRISEFAIKFKNFTIIKFLKKMNDGNNNQIAIWKETKNFYKFSSLQTLLFGYFITVLTHI